MDIEEAKAKELIKLAAEVLHDQPHVLLRETVNMYFLLPGADFDDSPRGKLHLYMSTGGGHNISLTPAQEVKLHMVWLQDEEHRQGFGANLSVHKVREVGYDTREA